MLRLSITTRPTMVSQLYVALLTLCLRLPNTVTVRRLQCRHPATIHFPSALTFALAHYNDCAFYIVDYGSSSQQKCVA